MSGLQNPRGQNPLPCFKRPDPILVPKEPLLIGSSRNGGPWVGWSWWEDVTDMQLGDTRNARDDAGQMWGRERDTRVERRLKHPRFSLRM